MEFLNIIKFHFRCTVSKAITQVLRNAVGLTMAGPVKCTMLGFEAISCSSLAENNAGLSSEGCTRNSA